MKIKYMIDKSHTGEIQFVIEYVDDLWYLYNIMLAGDIVTTTV